MKPKTDKYLRDLTEIVTIADELITSDWSTTSQHFNEWCDAEAKAKFLIQLLNDDGLESYLEKWIPETVLKLRGHLFMEP